MELILFWMIVILLYCLYSDRKERKADRVRPVVIPSVTIIVFMARIRKQEHKQREEAERRRQNGPKFLR